MTDAVVERKRSFARANRYEPTFTPMLFAYTVRGPGEVLVTNELRSLARQHRTTFGHRINTRHHSLPVLATCLYSVLAACLYSVLATCLYSSVNSHALHPCTTRPRKMAVAFVTGRVDMFDGDMEAAAATAAVAESKGCKVSDCRLACSRVLFFVIT